MICNVWMFFFFQAEDGIRDLVRSRGLGDVYKRQSLSIFEFLSVMTDKNTSVQTWKTAAFVDGAGEKAVSYTHLTLPTSDLV